MAEEQRLLDWLTSTSKPRPPAADEAPSQEQAAAARSADTERRDERLREMTRKLHAEELARDIRARSPRLSKAKADQHAHGWSRVLAQPRELAAWLEAGFAIGEHELAGRLIAAGVGPAQARAVRADPQAMSQLR